MADKKISQLNNLPTPQDADLIAVVDVLNDETKQTTFLQFKDRLRAILGLTGDDISDLDSRITNNSSVLANTSKISYTDASQVSSNTSKLSTIENNATADQTDSEIATAYQNEVGFATQAEMQAGTVTSERRMSPLRVKEAIDANSGGSSVALLAYVSATDSSYGFDATLALNTEAYDPDSITTLSSNQFTLDAGTYMIDGGSLSYDSSSDSLYLYNVTDATTDIVGGGALSDTTDPTTAYMHLTGFLVLTGTKTFEMRCSQGSTGINVGASSTLRFIKITKLA